MVPMTPLQELSFDLAATNLLSHCAGLRAGDRLLIVSTLSARAATERALQSVSSSGRLAGWVERADEGRDGE